MIGFCGVTVTLEGIVRSILLSVPVVVGFVLLMMLLMSANAALLYVDEFGWRTGARRFFDDRYSATWDWMLEPRWEPCILRNAPCPACGADAGGERGVAYSEEPPEAMLGCGECGHEWRATSDELPDDYGRNRYFG
jgi:hypothetical protein